MAQHVIYGSSVTPQSVTRSRSRPVLRRFIIGRGSRCRSRCGLADSPGGVLNQDRELSLTKLADKPLPRINEDRGTELSGLNVKSVIQAIASARRRHRPPIPGFPSD